MSVDGVRILERARALAFPRYPGTDANRRARDLVERSLREAGLDVRIEPFSYDVSVAFRAIRIVLVSAAALVATAGLLSLRSTLGALVVLAVGCVVGGVMVAWAPGAERIYARPGPTTTWNVEGRRRANGPARATLVLLAHYDSKSQNLSFPYRMGATLLAISVACAPPMYARTSTRYRCPSMRTISSVGRLSYTFEM